MKNIQGIDGAINTVYDIFATTEEEFAPIFPEGTDFAFIDKVPANGDETRLGDVFEAIWPRRLAKQNAMGIHGILLFGLEGKKAFYPGRRDEEAVNPDGSPLRC